jgi:hypothetical protein
MHVQIDADVIVQKSFVDSGLDDTDSDGKQTFVGPALYDIDKHTQVDANEIVQKAFVKLEDTEMQMKDDETNHDLDDIDEQVRNAFAEPADINVQAQQKSEAKTADTKMLDEKSEFSIQATNHTIHKSIAPMQTPWSLTRTTGGRYSNKLLKKRAAKQIPTHKGGTM